MDNSVIIATALNGHVRIYLADTTAMVNEAQKIHDMWPTSLAALGRTMSVTAIMGLQMKGEEESVTTTINGGGSIGTIMVTADSKGQVKGFVSDPHLYLKYNDSNKLAVGLVVGHDGYLQVLKNLKLKSSYTSQVSLVSGEIGDDFAYYFASSEQIPAIVSVGVLVDTDYSCKAAGCLLIELLPDHSEEDVEYLEQLLKGLKPISSVIAEGGQPLAYLQNLFADVKVLDRQSVRYCCDCSKERFLRNFLTLPKQDILELCEEEKTVVHCEFCQKDYEYSQEEMKKLLRYVKDR